MATDRPHTATAAGRRYLTVLFSDVSGSSQHAEQMEAEDYAYLLEQFRRIAREVIAQHGGAIARMQGDGILALFGQLASQEDDGRIAVEAALDLHDAMSQLVIPASAGIASLRLHSGVHSGIALLLEGDIERGRFDVVGEVPNTASRLCSLAAAGEVWVSESSLGPYAHCFEATRLRRIAIRGRAEPLNTLRIEGRVNQQRSRHAISSRGSLSPLVGRQKELDVLHEAAHHVRQGERSHWVLAGEPGIGKSRLLETLKRQLESDGYMVVYGSCEAGNATQPMEVFVSGLRTLAGCGTQSSTHDAEATARNFLRVIGAHALADGPVATRLAGAQSAQALGAGDIAEVLQAVTGHAPLVLLLDDWQWADDASHQVLQRLAEQNVCLCVVEGHRTPLPIEATHGRGVLKLQALSSEEVSQLIATYLPEASNFVVEAIVRSTGGNPLFAEELCRAGGVHSDWRSLKAGKGMTWLNALIASRLHTLQSTELASLQFAAVAGHAAHHDLLTLDGTDAQAQAAVQALLNQEYLVSSGPADRPGAVRFKHVLTRDAVYATVEPTRRRELHLQVAKSIERAARQDDASDPLEALAYHYGAAGVYPKAAHFAEAAGDKALALLASDRAREHYTSTLEALDTMELSTDAQLRRWCGIAQKLGNSCVFDPLAVSARLTLFRRAVKLAYETQDADLIARAEYWLSYINYGRGFPAAALRHGEAALYYAQEAENSRLVAQVQATLGQALVQGGRYERALPLLEQAVETKRQHSRPGSHAAIGSAYALSRRGYLLGDLGNFDLARDSFENALRLLGGNLHTVGASIHTTVAAVCLWQGAWADAATAAQQGMDIALRCRSHYLAAMGRALTQCAHWAESSDPSHLHALSQTARDMEAHGGGAWTSLIYGWLVEGHCRIGNIAAARQEAVKLFMRARLNDRHGLAMGCRALAQVEAERARFDRAARHLARAQWANDHRASPREAALTRDAQSALARRMGSTALA